MSAFVFCRRCRKTGIVPGPNEYEIQRCDVCGGRGYLEEETARSKSWIQSSQPARPLELLNPQPPQIYIPDVAYALAGINRFTSRARPRVNVAEHCVRVSLRCEELAASNPGPRGWEEAEHILKAARWGLLHDAPEAFVGDMARPLKHQPELAAYREIEEKHMACFVERFNLGPKPPEVEQADEELLWTEARDTMSPIHEDWSAGKHSALAHVKVIGWPPDVAEQMWLGRFAELFPEERIWER